MQINGWTEYTATDQSRVSEMVEYYEVLPKVILKHSLKISAAEHVYWSKVIIENRDRIRDQSAVPQDVIFLPKF